VLLTGTPLRAEGPEADVVGLGNVTVMPASAHRLDLLAVEVTAVGDGLRRVGADRLLAALAVLASCERSEPTLLSASRCSQCRLHSVRQHRQLAQALAPGQLTNGVGNRRGDHRHSGLTDAAWRIVRRDHLDLD